MGGKKREQSPDVRSSGSDKVRVQLDFTPELVDVLDAFVEQKRMASRTEFFRRAMEKWAEWDERERQFKELKKEGARLVAKYPDGREERLILMF